MLLKRFPTKRARHDSFLQWYFEERPKQLDPLIVSEDILRGRNEQRRRENYKELSNAEGRNELIKAALSEEVISIDLQSTGDFHPLELVGDEDRSLKFSLIRIQPKDYEVLIRKADISTLELSNTRGVRFENCRIRDLRIHVSEAEFSNCWIGRLNVPSRGAPAILFLKVEGGGIASIGECPQPSSHQPVDGDVIFNNVYFGRHHSPLIRGAQAYRNLRHHLSQLHNMPAANAIHSAELSIEREGQNRIHRLVSFFYELVCDFGGSVRRPVALWIALLVFCMIGLFAIDGVVTVHSETFAGWQLSLLGENWCARILRSAVLTFQSAASPLTVLAKPLVVARTPFIAAILTLYSTVSVLIFGMFLIAVRRTFRMS